MAYSRSIGLAAGVNIESYPYHRTLCPQARVAEGEGWINRVLGNKNVNVGVVLDD